MEETISKQAHDNIVHRLKCKLQVMERKFNIEKDAKNEAYAFILSCGHFEEYRVFNEKNIGADHYAMGIGAILDEVNKKPDYLMRLGGDN